MKLHSVLLVLGGLAGTSAVAKGQEVSLGIRGGVTIPAGAYGESAVSLGTGWNLGGVGRVDFGSSHFGMQIDFGYSANQIEGPPYGVVSDWQGGVGLVFLPLQMAAVVRPYLLAGVGIDYWQDNNGNGITPALYGSAGFDIRLDPIMPYAEMQYRTVLTPGSNLRTFQLILGLRYALSYR